MRRTRNLVLASTFALQSARAQAQSVCDDALIREANEARRAGHDAEALPLLQRAWATCHTPRALAQVGLAEAALGRWRDAERDLSAALAARGDPWIARNLPRLEEARARVASQVGSDADHDAAGASAPVVRHEPPAPRLLVASVPPPRPAASAAPVARGGVRRALAWTTLSLGAVALGGATAALVLREGEIAAFNADRACGANGGAVRGGARCVERYGDGASLETLSIVGYALGGALAVTSAILLAAGASRATARPERARFACALSLHTPGVLCGASF